MKTVFILTYFIMVSTNINKLQIDKKESTHPTYQAALDKFNEDARYQWLVGSSIDKKDILVDTVKQDLAVDTVIDINYNDSIHNIHEK